MKLAASNIGWDPQDNAAVYTRMQELGYTGLEIAPTKFFATQPYAQQNAAAVIDLAASLMVQNGLAVVSMQSIWYGRSESIWGSREEQQALVDYTAAAARFAAAAGCGNLVFGCPRNRNMPQGADVTAAMDFFRRAGDAVAPYGVSLSLEPNPPIYNTNFLNTTAGCAAFLRQLGHPALGMNLDVGTMIENGEDVDVVADNIDLIRHVHISRPGLVPVEKLPLHARLADTLRAAGYSGWVSLEMKQADLPVLFEALQTVAQAFGAN